jgi:hypothetical protein
MLLVISKMYCLWWIWIYRPTSYIQDLQLKHTGYIHCDNKNTAVNQVQLEILLKQVLGYVGCFLWVLSCIQFHDGPYVD